MKLYWVRWAWLAVILGWSGCNADEPGRFCWVGGVTANSATVKVGFDERAGAVKLWVAEQADFSEARSLEPHKIAASVAEFRLSGLEANKVYYYAPEVGGERIGALSGRFRAFPEGRASFAFAFGSCAKGQGRNDPIFDRIRGMDPLFFLHTGDFHYWDIGVNDVQRFRDAYEEVLSAPRQAALYRQAPIAYMWDDHDFGPNNSDRTAPGRAAARQAYREYAPHYPLPAGDGDAAVYHAFTVGRVRFIMCDARSERTPYKQEDQGDKTMLGEPQKAWFKKQLLEANGKYPLIVWVNTLPWIGDSSDGWSFYDRERRELANFIKDNRIRGLCMLSGDAHMLAIDDGSHSDYADGGGAAFPVMHAASLAGGFSVKGGPYSHKAIPGGGHFGWMEVDDRGDRVVVRWRGYKAEGEVLMSHEFQVEAAE